MRRFRSTATVRATKEVVRDAVGVAKLMLSFSLLDGGLSRNNNAARYGQYIQYCTPRRLLARVGGIAEPEPNAGRAKRMVFRIFAFSSPTASVRNVNYHRYRADHYDGLRFFNIGSYQYIYRLSYVQY